MDSRVQVPQKWRADTFQHLRSNSADISEERIAWSHRACELATCREPRSDAPSANLPTPLRILLVDDTYSNRRLVELILRRRGHRVLSVSDANSAIAAAGDADWDVILMDLQMPQMNGWEATAAIRRREQEEGRRPVPIIALTAYTIAGNRERSLQAGMDDFLTKPIDPQMLSEVVELFGSQRNLDE